MAKTPINPFTPMRAATLPDEFFGRAQELDALKRAIELGHIAIQGSIGIGKSSLLERLRQIEEGFDEGGARAATTHVAVGNADVRSLDEAANLILKRMVVIDQRQTSRKFSFAKLIGIEASVTDTISFFPPNRRLDVLETLLLKAADADPEMLIVLAFDEADKCPLPLARLFRSIVTFCDLTGLRNVRLAVAGVNPYFQRMTDEDPGIVRFFTKVVNLLPMPMAEAAELVETKLNVFCERCWQPPINRAVHYDPDFINTLVNLAGGHPHLLQLLGFHAIEKEIEDPDGAIDQHDLVGSLQTICYNDRKFVYDSILHTLEVQGKLNSLRDLFLLASSHCPTLIPRRDACDQFDTETMEWFVSNNILAAFGPDHYRLIDEFLRVRILLDDSQTCSVVERQLIHSQNGISEDFVADDEDDPDGSYDEDFDEEEEALLPELKAELVGSSPLPGKALILDVYAKSDADDNPFLSAEFDQIIVVLISSSGNIVARTEVLFDSDVAIESKWSHVAKVTLAGQPAGKYIIRPQIKVTEESRETQWFHGQELELNVGQPTGTT